MNIHTYTYISIAIKPLDKQNYYFHFLLLLFSIVDLLRIIITILILIITILYSSTRTIRCIDKFSKYLMSRE